MSTFTTIFGMLPLVLMPGEGSVIYRGLATTIVGGMICSLFFTLLMLPSLLRFGAARSIVKGIRNDAHNPAPEPAA
jgi:multidrug efflux pump subunit AcrB